MSTESFFTDMVIDTEEGIRNLEKAFEDADNHVPCILDNENIEPLTVIWDLEEVRKFLKW